MRRLLGDKKHHVDTQTHGEHLIGRRYGSSVLHQGREDADGGDVDEAASYEAEHPLLLWKNKTGAAAEDASHRRAELSEQSLFGSETILDQDGKIRQVVRDLVEEDGNSCCDATALDERDPQSQAIREIMQTICNEIEVGSCSRLGGLWCLLLIILLVRMLVLLASELTDELVRQEEDKHPRKQRDSELPRARHVKISLSAKMLQCMRDEVQEHVSQEPSDRKADLVQMSQAYGRRRRRNAPEL
mmetsp:Transcript_3525/g.12306  ORF Transcript_3525/g.12306 Transcript_3525/m.12306 type:complete len:244 (+) Transcript_3525:2765-3496(+)